MLYNNERQEYTKQFDRQSNSLIEKQQQPFGEAFIKSNSPQNINASRPTRLLPTHGGKPGKTFGQGTYCNPSNLLKYFSLCKFIWFCKTYIGAAPPRLYYVIALRRILC